MTKYSSNKPELWNDDLSVSVIIPTYNRCPFSDDKRNPLFWCLSSVKQQSADNLEIIVVDDASTDLTHEKIKNLRNIHYIQNKERKGSSMSRNIGTEKADSDLVLFLDDDCLFLNKYAIDTARYSLGRVKEEETEATAMHLSVYWRTNTYKDILPTKEILSIDYEGAHIFCNTDSFPEERIKLKDNDYLSDTRILKPVKVDNLAGVFLCERDTYLSTGGFPSNFPPPALGEEHVFAQRLIGNGHKIFFSPEPKAATVHFKYGRKDKGQIPSLIQKQRNAVEPPLPIEEMLEESRNAKEKDTGNAVTPEQALYSYIFGRLMIFNGNEESKQTLKARFQRDIIDKNKYSYYSRKINNKGNREAIYLDAIDAAEQEYNKYKKRMTHAESTPLLVSN